MIREKKVQRSHFPTILVPISTAVKVYLFPMLPALVAFSCSCSYSMCTVLPIAGCHKGLYSSIIS